MNSDIFEGKWMEMRGQVKEWWGKLTDDELDQTHGKAEQLVGLIQQRYGYTRQQAEEEFERRIRESNGDASEAVHHAVNDALDDAARAVELQQTPVSTSVR